MAYAIALLALWVLVFFPLGIAFHWLVLGAGARAQALPLALLSGLSAGIVLLGAARQANVDVAAAPLQLGFVAVAVVLLVVAWRRGITLVDRPLVGSMVLLLVAVTLVQMPVFGGPTAGPLGQGTGYEPVVQVAEISRVAEGSDAASRMAQRAAATADRQYRGFEQLAGFTVAAGRGVEGWTPGSLHSLVMGVVAMLVVLPLFVFARWRGVGRLGLVVALLVGVLSPMTYLAMGLAQASTVAAVPFLTAAMLAVLIARRDRGWYALAVLYAGAVLVLVGPLGLLPLVAMAAVWALTFRSTHEHVSKAVSEPVTADRPAAAGVLVAMFAVYATAASISAGIVALPASAMFERLVDALLAWPFAWLGPGLVAEVPQRIGELAVWMVGPLLLAIALAYGIARREMREVAVIGGVAVTVLAGAAWSLASGAGADAGIALVEYAWLAGAPLLAVIVIRATGLSRAAAEKAPSRFNAAGPMALLTVLVLFSVASTTVTGTRMTHAPAAPEGARASSIANERTLTLAESPWVDYMYDAERPRVSGITDADQLVRARPDAGVESLVYGPYHRVVLDTNPFSSDPPARYVQLRVAASLSLAEESPFAARIFTDTHTDPAAGMADADQPRTATAETLMPTRHHPVEDEPGSGIGGMLVPSGDIEGCGIRGVSTACAPPAPDRSEACTDEMVAAARKRFANSQVGGAAAGESRPLLGIACWQVPLGERTQLLMVHLRDVGIVLSPDDAYLEEPDAPAPPANGHVPGVPGVSRPRVNADGLAAVEGRDVRMRYGNGRLPAPVDVTVEGRFGAGATLDVNDGTGLDATTSPVSLFAGPGLWSPTFMNLPRGGDVVITNTSDSRLELGRVVVRPTDMHAGCNAIVQAAPQAFRNITDGTEPRMSLYVHDVSRIGGQRVATLVFSTYQQVNGLPRHTLVDWVQQYDAEVPGSDCFRTIDDPMLPPGGGAGMGDGASASGSATGDDTAAVGDGAASSGEGSPGSAFADS